MKMIRKTGNQREKAHQGAVGGSPCPSVIYGTARQWMVIDGILGKAKKNSSSTRSKVNARYQLSKLITGMAVDIVHTPHSIISAAFSASVTPSRLAVRRRSSIFHTIE